MPALYVMIPAALLIVAVAVYIFFWAVDTGQYDDLEGPAHSILFDDQHPQHKAAVNEATVNKAIVNNENHSPAPSDNGQRDETPPHA